MADAKPVTITRVATESYTGSFTPEPLLMVGDPLADPVASDADVSALIDDTESDTRASLDTLYGVTAEDTSVSALIEDAESDTRVALDTLYGADAEDASVAALVADAESDTRVALDLVYTAVAVTDTDVSALVDDTESDTRSSLDTLYDFATIAPAITGYSGAATQTLKHVSGTLTWVTDGA